MNQKDKRPDAGSPSKDKRSRIMIATALISLLLSGCGGGGGGADAAGNAVPDDGTTTGTADGSTASDLNTFSVMSDPGFNPAFDQTDRIGGGLTIEPAFGSDDYRPAGYDELVFADEFDGSELDRSKWCTRFSWGGGQEPLQMPDEACTRHGQGTLDFVNDEWQRYRDFNRRGEALHEMRDGVIALRATKNSADPADRTFEAAMLRSKQTFRPEGAQMYYMTVRVKLPSARGTWPMVWLAPALDDAGNSQWPPEIDILEAPVNDDTETIYNLYQHLQIHRNQTVSGGHEYDYADPAYNTQWGYWKSVNSLRDIWLEVGTEWGAEHVCHYINGRALACEKYRWVDNDGNVANPGSLLINMAIGGGWAGKNGVDLSRFPVKMELDHVRIYRR